MDKQNVEFIAVPLNHPERPSIEQFIGSVFMHCYQAKIQHFADVLLGVKNEQGNWIAALGFTAARGNSLFVENYGGGSVEQQISAKLSAPVERKQIVEVGNLAATSAGATRRLISAATAYLYQQGFSWVIFTATRPLLNAFHRLDLRPIVLAPANPECLPDQGKSWGSYYRTKPQIMAGSILLGQMSMESRPHSTLGIAA